MRQADVAPPRSRHGRLDARALLRGAAQLPAFLRTLDGASITAMWACIGAARLLPRFLDDAVVSDPIVAVLAVPLLAIVPRQIGIVLRPLAGALIGGRRVQLAAADAYVVEWLAGIWLVVLSATILTGLLGIPATVVTALVLTAATLTGVSFGLRAVIDREDTAWSVRLALAGHGWPIVAALVLVSVPLALIRVNQPYPLQVGWGLLNYNYRVLQFVESDHIAIAPGLHTPIHAALVGASGLATGAEFHGVLWATPLLLYVVYGLGVFAFSRRILGESPLALVALWGALWVLALTGFRHLHAAGMRGVILAIWPWVLLLLHGQLPSLQGRPREVGLHLLMPIGAMAGVALVRWFLPSTPQVWGLLLLGALFVGLVRSLPEDLRQSVGLLTFVGASLTFVHIIEGPLFFAVGLGFALLLSWRLTSVPSRVLLGAAQALVIAFVVLQMRGILTFDDPSTISRFFLGSARADAIILTFDGKLDGLKDGLTYPIMGLLALSAIRTLIWPNSTHLAALAMITCAIGLYFLPESGFHRVPGPIIPLLGLSIALEIGWWARRLPRLLWRDPHPFWAGALAAAALIALTPTLTSPLRSQVGLPSKLGFPLPQAERSFSNITVPEYRASTWIKENIPEDWVIVSDPATMFVMEGLTFHPQVARERAWVAESEYSDEDQRRLRSLEPLVFGAPDVEDAVEGIESLTAEHPGYLVVYSHRTLEWSRDPDTLFSLGWPVEALLEKESLQSFCGYYGIEPCPSRFLEGEYLSVVYNEDGVAVLVPPDRLAELDVK